VIVDTTGRFGFIAPMRAILPRTGLYYLASA
jgi:hypothetical protein